MGMEIIEFVMDVEAEFGIDLPDEEFSREPTVGRLCDMIVRSAQTQRGQELMEQDVFLRLRAILSERYGIRPHDIVREASIARDLGLD